MDKRTIVPEAGEANGICHHAELAERRQNMEHSLSDTGALMHLVKGLVGTGILSMAAGYFYAGIWTGLVMTPIVVILNVHAMKIVIRQSHFFSVRNSCPSMDYSDTAIMSLSNGPTWANRWATCFGRSINVFLYITQLGFCCTYIAFTAQNVKQIVESATHSNLPISVYIFLVTIPLFFLVSIRHLSHITLVSMTGNVVYVTGFAVTFYYIFSTIDLDVRRPAFNSIETLPLAFGIIMFSFEAVSLIMPIENQMKHPADLTTPFGVLNVASLIVLALYCSVGFFGYLRFGEAAKTAGTISLNLPSDVLYQIVRAFFCLAVYTSYAVQFYVPIEMVMSFLNKRYQDPEDKRKRLVIEYSIRYGLLIFTFAMAELIPHVDLFVSLVGSISCSALTLFFPPLMEICFLMGVGKPENRWTSIWCISKDVLLIIIGLVGAVAGTYSSILMIVVRFRDRN